MRFEIGFDTGRLRFPECEGRLTVYAFVRVGERTWWISRWDTWRATKNRLKSRDGKMGWTWGTRTTKSVAAAVVSA